MTPSVQRCDRARLEKLLSGSLSEPDERAVIEHLDTCESCQRALEAASGDASSWTELQSSLADDIQDEIERRVAAFAANGDGGDPATIAACTFLAPSDDPRMLGRIGLYEIAGLVGRGGAGVVFKAFEPSLQRYVAIKAMAPELIHSSAARKRFAREAQAAAAVTHEHIVPIYAVSEFQGVPYIVMQYVPGHSLQERLDRHAPLDVVEIVRIALQTARALAAAHQQGLVHRDIKPGNILLTTGVENVLVTDFGLARAVDDASLTHSGMISGTPQYMSPEQARGESAGSASDLFSLGSVIYTMSTGRPPFRAETLLGAMRRVCEEIPRPMREINPAVPEWLDGLAAKLHAKAPENRFRDAAALAEVLEGELAHLQNPTAIRQPLRPWLREGQLAKLRRWRWAALGVAAAFAAAPGIAWWGGALGAGPATDQPQSAANAADAAPKVDSTTNEWRGIRIATSAEDGRVRVQPTPQQCLVQLEFAGGALHTVAIKSDEIVLSSNALRIDDRKRWEVSPCVEINIAGARDRLTVTVIERHSTSNSAESSHSASANGATTSESSSSSSTSETKKVESLVLAVWKGKKVELLLSGGDSVESAVDADETRCRIEFDIDDGKHKRTIDLESRDVKVDGAALGAPADYSEVKFEAARKELSVNIDGKILAAAPLPLPRVDQK